MQNNFNFNNIQTLIIDMDGVLWRGNTPLPGLTRFFDFLYSHSLSFILATNNASKTPAQYRQKLANFGVTIKPENVLTSSLATATYLKGKLNKGGKVYVIGQEGLREAMGDAGFTLVDDASQPAEAVVSGIDFHLTYDKLKYAVLLIQQGARVFGQGPALS
jgi:4-nitrophenyl phosphatase